MFRFTIRDLLWLTLLFGVAITWWQDHNRLTRDKAAQLGHIIKEYDAAKVDLEWTKHSFGQRLNELDANANDFKAFQDERMRHYRESQHATRLNEP